MDKMRISKVKVTGLRKPLLKNQTEAVIHIKRILAYSARKIKAKSAPVNSMLKPDTISDSHSAKSNGARVVSATVFAYLSLACGSFNRQRGNEVWAAWSQEDVFIKKTGNNNTSSILTSYEIVCATARRAPKKAYLEFEAHPANIVPYTFNAVTQKNSKTPQTTYLYLKFLG